LPLAERSRSSLTLSLDSSAAHCSSLTPSLSALVAETRVTSTHKSGPILRPGKNSLSTASRDLGMNACALGLDSEKNAIFSSSFANACTTRCAKRIKQSALALLAKPPLDSSLLFSTAGQCRPRVSRRQSLLDLAAAFPSPQLRFLCHRLSSTFSLLPRGAFTHSTSRRYPSTSAGS
jgi:hypothetical protein